MSEAEYRVHYLSTPIGTNWPPLRRALKGTPEMAKSAAVDEVKKSKKATDEVKVKKSKTVDEDAAPKKAKSNISGSGTLDLSQEEFEKAMKYKDYGKSGGIVPDGLYHTIVEEVTRTVSTGAATKGSPKYTLKLRVLDGEHTGRTILHFVIAAGSTAGQYFNLLEAFGEEAKQVGRSVEVKTSAQIAKWVGQNVDINVTTRKAPASGPYADKRQVNTSLIRVENKKKAKIAE